MKKSASFELRASRITAASGFWRLASGKLPGRSYELRASSCKDNSSCKLRAEQPGRGRLRLRDTTRDRVCRCAPCVLAAFSSTGCGSLSSRDVL